MITESALSIRETILADSYAFVRRVSRCSALPVNHLAIVSAASPLVGLCKISGSHGDEYEDGCLLGCCFVYSGKSLLTFQLRAPMNEAAGTSETSVNIYQTTRLNIPEDSYLDSRRRENLKFHIIMNFNS
jgi:hypothetical protein